MRYIIKVDPRLKIEDPDKLSVTPWVVYVNGDITEASAETFRREIECGESAAIASGQSILPVIIDSYGGDVYALLSMMDAIATCKIKVATIVEGKAFSAGASLFTCGAEGYRFMGPNATLMIHEASQWTGGKVEELKRDAAELDRLNTLIFQKMATNCRKSKGYFLRKMNDVSHSDWYLDAKEAVEHNVANHIRIPSIEVEIKAVHKFR